MALIEVSDAGFAWPRRAGAGREAFERVSFEVEQGELVAILGPSGCGKSSLLQCTAGLEDLQRGSIRIDGGRPLLLFQDAYLLPWLTVEENVLSGRTLASRRKTFSNDVSDILSAIGMLEHRSLHPHELSGGMRQRAALGRALANGASILLMDEPFSALDHLTRTRMGEFLLTVRETFGVTIVFVTHSVDEAAMLADRILMMSGSPGTIAQRIEVDLPRPRGLADPDFNRLRGEILSSLAETAAADPRARRPPSPPAPATVLWDPSRA